LNWLEKWRIQLAPPPQKIQFKKEKSTPGAGTKSEPSGLAFLRENETAPVSKTLTPHNRGSVFSACARTSIRGFLGNSALFSGTDLISRNLGRSGMGSAKNFSEP